MAVGVYSKFYYGYELTIFNNRFQFNDGTDDIDITIPPRTYTPTQLASRLESLLNEASGGEEYTVTFNRSSRSFTLSSDGATFNILVSSGSLSGFGIYGLLGLGSSDLTGQTSYTGGVSGSEYKVQFPIQDYVSHLDWVDKIDSTVNKSVTGQVELVSYGDISFTEFEIKFISNKNLMGGSIIRHNPTGLNDFRDLMTFLIKKAPVEFMLDGSDPDSFINLVLESTEENTNGTAFKLIEETSNNLPDVYRSGVLTFRVI